MEKVVASKQLMVGCGDRRKKKSRLENDETTKLLSLVMETDKERNARLEKMVATAQVMLALTKGVVHVVWFCPLKPF